MITLSLLVSLLVACVSLLVFGKPTIVFYGYGVVTPIILLAPYVGYLWKRGSVPAFTRRVLRWYGGYALATIAINAPASLYFHPAGIQYDRFVHFAVAYLAFVFLCHMRILLLRTKKAPMPNRTPFLLLSAGVLALGLFVWEGYQYAVDAVFGSTLFFDVGQDIVIDVAEDIVYGAAGIIGGVVYTALRWKRFLNKM